MGRDIPLGRIAGIKVGMDLTVIVIALLNTVLLATNRFPIESPDLSTTAYWIAGVAGALLFFVSLLVHEMGHALVARDEGIGVRGISLWLLGGVAKLESSPTTPGSELRIAVVGPVASAACGAAFLAMAYVLPSGGHWGLAANLLAWLGLLNLLLAAFNILPAAPLDGGTVLSAIVWQRTGSQAKGMRWAAIAGITSGSAMAVWALRDLQSGDDSQYGIWVLAVGAFIAYSAFRSMRSAPLYELLEGSTVADAMEPSPPLAPTSAKIADFLRSLPHDTSHQAYPVVGSHGRVDGLLTAAAIRAVPPNQWDSLRVADLAYPLDRITVVTTTEALLPAVQKIDGGDVRDGLVVTPDGAIAGIIDANGLYLLAERRRSELVAAR